MRQTFPDRRLWTWFTFLLAGAGCAHRTPSTASPTADAIVVEDFEGYGSDPEIAKSWYKPPHGGQVTPTVGPGLSGRGKQALRVLYETEGAPQKHYSAVCRVSKWNLAGTDAVRFWLKPDGSGRKLKFELNIANASGKNIHDLWSTEIPLEAGDVAPREVTVPFAQLVQNTKHADAPDVSPVFKPEAVIEFAFYVGSRDDARGKGELWVDDITAVRSSRGE